MNIEWCSICNARPSDGMLEVDLEGQIDFIPACEPCVRNPKEVTFI